MLWHILTYIEALICNMFQTLLKAAVFYLSSTVLHVSILSMLFSVSDRHLTSALTGYVDKGVGTLQWLPAELPSSSSLRTYRGFVT